MRGFRLLPVLCVLGLSLLTRFAAAAECPPNYPAGLPCPKQPWETLQLEHNDRTQRLLRLAQGRVGFEFYPIQIQPGDLGVPGFPVAVPVLRVVANQDLFFDNDSDEIRPEAYPLLDIIAGDLKLEPPDVSVFIAGHTDAKGSIEYNQALGLRRAQAVAAALVRRGIYQASVYRVSFGKLVPIASNDTAEGRARNRRVEFLFSGRTEAIIAVLKRQAIAPCMADQSVGLEDCKAAIHVEAAKVIISPQSEAAVVHLDQAYQRITSDPNLSPIEMRAEARGVEQARAKIPVDLSVERIPIDLDGQ
jgi:outer membrane protein OmpA-like peptidoglycan-associated protein